MNDLALDISLAKYQSEHTDVDGKYNTWIGNIGFNAILGRRRSQEVLPLRAGLSASWLRVYVSRCVVRRRNEIYSYINADFRWPCAERGCASGQVGE